MGVNFRLVDNLPCATRYEIGNTNEVIYENGYRLGWEEDGRFYVNNHLDIILRYHQPGPDVYRVVGFEVQPQSIESSRFKFTDSPVGNFSRFDQPCTLWVNLCCLHGIRRRLTAVDFQRTLL